ncbi:MAG TPA: hypothetical protein VGG38_19780 [Acidimicrobiales bacterium]|jgi:hypothetical protein
MSIVAPKDAAPPGFWGDLRDAVEPRTALLVVGALLLQLGFILSFIGAFHSPTPTRVPVDLVVSRLFSEKVVSELDHLPGDPVQVRLVGSAVTAKADVTTGRVDGAFVVQLSAAHDQLFVASGAGAATATALETVFDRVEAHVHRNLTTTDLVPLQSGDGHGLSGYYLVTGWIVGGYLMASLLGVAKGAQPTTVRRAIIRLLAVLPYAVVGGAGGALIAGPWLGALDGHYLELWLLGFLLIFSSAAIAMALQSVFGVVGIGLTILIFVVIGNPSAGGAYQYALLPPFWRDIGPKLPNGAGTDAARQIVYFGSHGLGGSLLIVAAYVVGGSVVMLIGSSFHQRRNGATEAEQRLVALGRAGYPVEVRR